MVIDKNDDKKNIDSFKIKKINKFVPIQFSFLSFIRFISISIFSVLFIYPNRNPIRKIAINYYLWIWGRLKQP